MTIRATGGAGEGAGKGRRSLWGAGRARADGPSLLPFALAGALLRAAGRPTPTPTGGTVTHRHPDLDVLIDMCDVRGMRVGLHTGPLRNPDRQDAGRDIVELRVSTRTRTIIALPVPSLSMIDDQARVALDRLPRVA